MRAFLFLVLISLVAPFLGAVQAQDVRPAAADTVRSLTEIELRDGSRFVGTVVSETDTQLILVTTGGTEVRIEKSQIVSRRVVSGRSRDGDFRQFDPNGTRLFFGPTGRSLEKGRGYVADYYVVFGFVAYAITDRVTLAGGTFLIPQAVGDLIYVAPKVTLIERGSDAGSVGVLAGMVKNETAGILYGAWTHGRPDGALTLGLGFGFGNGKFASDPVIMLGGEKAMGRNTKFIGESYLIPTAGGGAWVMGGVRFFGSRLAADLGLMGFVGADDGGFPALPWLGFSYNFGQ
ncbi:MAG: hypothetical protein ACI80V_000771 [Rhodothermales bacterium]|jgi:hypothetical protein